MLTTQIADYWRSLLLKMPQNADNLTAKGYFLPAVMILDRYLTTPYPLPGTRVFLHLAGVRTLLYVQTTVYCYAQYFKA